MVFGAAGREHFQIALGEAFRRLLVNPVQRVHQAIAEGIGVNVERRVHKVRNIGPEGLVTRLELDRFSEALPLHLEPERVETLDSHLPATRSEEHTSELQSHHDLVCRLLLEKKKHNQQNALTKKRNTQ